MESEKKQELVIDGNSFYEIDLKCLKEKKQKQEEAEKRQQKRQRMIQQLSLQPLLLQPQPLLFPQQHIRQMIQRIQEQLFPPFPNREFPQPLLQPQLLLHPHPVLHPESQPHPQSHPQLVAAKSLIDKSSSKFYLHFIIWQESVHSYKKVDSVYSLRYNKRNVTFL